MSRVAEFSADLLVVGILASLQILEVEISSLLLCLGFEDQSRRNHGQGGRPRPLGYHQP